jgi:glycosyltransferase involved in cell wall biosynthesis
MTRRILFVAMHNSIHVARWIEQIADRGWDLHLFPVSNVAPHPRLAGVTVHWPLSRFWPRQTARLLTRSPAAVFEGRSGIEKRLFPQIHSRSLSALPSAGLVDLLRRVFPALRVSETQPRPHSPFGPRMLARAIATIAPDLIHSMEFQHAGYPTLWAKDLQTSQFPAWLATNWGSDIYYFHRIGEHRPLIERLLRAIDLYSCECDRDVDLARDLGFGGTALPVMPNSGGFAADEIARLGSGMAPSHRRLILVKGYQHFAGRALTALAALEQCADALTGYRILVFSASPEIRPHIRALAATGRLNVAILDQVGHDEMLRLHGQARLYVGISISDAISTSLLEAMAMGAFPIQTNTSCCDEWIVNGRSGYSVPVDDIDVIAARIRQALSDDALVDTAATINAETVRQRLDSRVLKKRIGRFYDEAFAAIDAKADVQALPR